MIKKICIGLSVVLVICLFSIGMYIDKNSRYTDKPKQEDKTFAIDIMQLDEEQCLVNAVIVEWMNGEYTAEQLYDSYRSKLGRLDSPAPVIIKFSVENIPENDALSSIVLEVSENENFENPILYTLKLYERELKIYNLKTGQKYYCRVTAKTKSGKLAESVQNFTTAYSPRLIAVEGIRNVRDIGGFKTVDGKTVKQGLLFRGTELRGTVKSDFNITEAGIDVLVNDLKIKNELDLRFSSDRGEPIGNNVTQKFYKFKYLYSEIFSDEAKKCIKNLFSDLALEETYPAYIHCTYGSDRTGNICYFLQALLGMSEEDCIRNWELTTFFNGGSYKDDFLQFVDNMKKIEGDTLQEKTENFLLSTGLTVSQLDDIKRIFLE